MNQDNPHQCMHMVDLGTAVAHFSRDGASILGLCLPILQKSWTKITRTSACIWFPEPPCPSLACKLSCTAHGRRRFAMTRSAALGPQKQNGRGLKKMDAGCNASPFFALPSARHNETPPTVHREKWATAVPWSTFLPINRNSNNRNSNNNSNNNNNNNNNNNSVIFLSQIAW